MPGAGVLPFTQSCVSVSGSLSEFQLRATQIPAPLLLNAGAAPVISLVGTSVRTYTIGEGLRITTALVPESVCDGAKVRGAARPQAR